MLPIETLTSMFDRKTWERGAAYHREGRASIDRRLADGMLVQGMVTGSNGIRYRVQVGASRDNEGRYLPRARCTCPVGSFCKHSVALLLEAVARDPLAEPIKGPTAEASRGSTARPPDALPPPVQEWLRSIETARTGSVETYPESIRQRLIYVVTEYVWPVGKREARVRCVSTRLLKDGSFSSSSTTYDPANIHNSQGGAKFLRPSDRSILGRLSRLRSHPGVERTLTGEEGASVLTAMIETGRARWEDVSGPVLRWGEGRGGRVTWRVASDGHQRPTLELADGDEARPSLAILPVTPPVALVPADGGEVVAHPLELAIASQVLAALLDAPALTPDQVEPVRARLDPVLREKLGEKVAEALPRTIPKAEAIDLEFVPGLYFFGAERSSLGYWPRHLAGRQSQHLLIARPRLRYGDIIVDPTERSRVITRWDGDRLLRLERSSEREDEARRQLADIGFEPILSSYQYSMPSLRSGDLCLMPKIDSDDEWLRVLLEDVPRLRAEGWEIDISPDFPIRPLVVDGPIEADLGPTEEGSGIDWFDLSLGTVVEGERIDLLPALLQVLSAMPVDGLIEMLDDLEDEIDSLRLPLPDGRVLVISLDTVRPILTALINLLGTDAAGHGPPRLSTLDMEDLIGFEEALKRQGIGLAGAEKIRALGQRLRQVEGPTSTVDLPDHFTGDLRPYQRAGVAWMGILREVGLGGILADDMGLGKTVQTLAHLCIEKAEGRLEDPALIVAPTSLMGNWRAEAAAFAPHLKTLILQGPNRKADFDRIGEFDLVFTTYPLLSHDGAVLTARPWSALILDEAQAIKNPRTTAARTLRRVEASHRLALTGTPVENNLGELWSLFDTVSPGLLGDRKTFASRWRTPIEQKGDGERQERLSRRLRPFLLRRSKADVLAELPPRTDIVEHVTLEEGQRAIYEAIRYAMHSKVREAIAEKGLARSRIELLEALLRLRQVCCDPRLVAALDQAQAENRIGRAGSAKLNRLMELLPELVGEGRRILLFSQFTSMLALIEEAVTNAGIEYLKLTGQTKKRAEVVARFQSGAAPLFLISLKAGGTGLNLTAADTVIHYDPWWNPAVENQATDRVHRIGQDKPVFVHRLLAEDTIEGKMQLLKDRKQALADGLYDPEGSTPFEITDEDVEFLLGEQ